MAIFWRSRCEVHHNLDNSYGHGHDSRVLFPVSIVRQEFLLRIHFDITRTDDAAVATSEYLLNHGFIKSQNVSVDIVSRASIKICNYLNIQVAQSYSPDHFLQRNTHTKRFTHFLSLFLSKAFKRRRRRKIIIRGIAETLNNEDDDDDENGNDKIHDENGNSLSE